MFRQFDHQQGLDAERLRIDLGMYPAQNVGIAEPPDTYVQSALGPVFNATRMSAIYNLQIHRIN